MSRDLYRRSLWVLLLTILLLASARPALAQENEQAGLVIVTGSGEPATYCVDIDPDETMSGNELLQRAGVKVVADQNAMGATICSLNGTGCAFPAQSCFCQCEGTPCTYWSYWRQDEAGAWQYATAGAANTRIRAGTVEGWVWGEGTTSTAMAPPALTLADICAAPESAATIAPAGAPQAIVQAGAVPPDAVPAGPAASAQVASAPAEAERPQENNQSWALAGLAALVVVPVAALLLLRRRKDNA